MSIKRTFCLLAVFFISNQSMAMQKKSSSAVPATSPMASKYEPSPEQMKLINARRSFAHQFFKSDIEFDFYDSTSIRSGTLGSLRVKKPEAKLYRPSTDEISRSRQLIKFIEENRSLFQIDEETILTLKDISLGQPTGAFFLQTYKGLPVLDSIIWSDGDGGISSIHSRLVPSSKLSLAEVKPQVTPEKVVEINWGGWLAEGSKFTIGKAKQLKGMDKSYSVPVTRTITQDGKKIVEKKTALVSLVVYPKSNATRLAWCFHDNTSVYDAISGEMIEGPKGPFPAALFPAIRPSVCPYRIL